ncbi:hypothetical protein CY658_12130 [Variovorax sp. RO1]|uniref:hypothetical protein n=1 Tax=Variovorax sp. RO1 TaxID=2066034 RepID=UPI000C716E16|nr:hypothetical protein [Variovorax sp. RO1]PLC04584.1 hypothetical protein CY658_12130 [Variovorax sp. RO1]
MQITIRGELTMAQLRQAIFEQLVQLENVHALAFSQGATLYVNPSDGCGSPVELKAKDGRKVTKILSDGPYRSAAEDYKI